MDCFHSISFPSEWGDKLTGKHHMEFPDNSSFHSISFPSEWGEAEDFARSFSKYAHGFHSISFPSEWGVLYIKPQTAQDV